MVPRWGRPLQTWKTFIHNHAEGIASIDLFVVPTIAFLLFALVVLGHKRRQLLWFAVCPTRVYRPYDRVQRRALSAHSVEVRQLL
jgi:hypothetical protein